MQARTLVNDVQRCNSDVDFIFKNAWERMRYSFIDETAQRIADFVSLTRPHSKPVFAIQREELTKTFRRALSPEEAAIHRVAHFEADPILPKTRWSVVPENKEFFEEDKRSGTDTYILIGFWADKCLPENAEDLLDMGHRVIVPVDLTSGMESMFTPEAYIDLAYNERFVLSDAYHVAQMLQTPVEQRRMPKAKFSAQDIFSMSYGFGS